MSDSANEMVISRSLPWFIRRITRRLSQRLSGLEYGQLTIILPNQQRFVFGSELQDKPLQNAPRAIVYLRNYKPIKALMLKGELAFAESYLAGDWETPDLETLFHLAIINENRLSLKGSRNWISYLREQLNHRRNANTKKGSKKNIAFHYDLGNKFYQYWLDPSMTYSSGMDLNDQSKFQDLEKAQQQKYAYISDLLGLQSGQSLLEIGCGWGGFSEHVVQRHDVKIKGITLSKEQQSFAQQRYQTNQIDHKASAILEDYRDSHGIYDHIISIEMFEAVGKEHWDIYFNKLHELLRKGGTAALQIITIADTRFDYYERNVDFIQKYIFPGGMLPSDQVLKEKIEKAGFQISNIEMFGKSYAQTCRLWREKFIQNWPLIEALGFDERFKRLWLYYLTYCQIGFEHGSINVGVFHLKK